MGLFSSEAHVSLDAVRRFKEEVNSFSNEINNVASTISKQINEGLEEAVQKVKTFEKLKNECNELYEEIKKRKSELEQLELLAKIKKSGIERREYKDFITLVEPLIDFIQDDKNEEDADFIELINENCCNIELKDKGILIS